MHGKKYEKILRKRNKKRKLIKVENGKSVERIEKRKMHFDWREEKMMGRREIKKRGLGCEV